MTENTTETTAPDAADQAVTEEKAAPVFAKGSWQAAIQRSAALFDRSGSDRKRASTLLWTGAQAAIGEWAEDKSATDVHAEVLYADVLDIMGTSRKGDVSKIKTVALAVRNKGLVLSTFANLSKAYAEARRLTVTEAQDAADDDAAEKAVEALADSVPHSTTTVEGSALLLLSRGIDGAVVAILDALGANNEAAHRAFIRAMSTEVASRIQAAKPKPAPKAGPKAGATASTGATKATTAKPAATKAKAKPSTGDRAAATRQADPTKKALPVKAKPGAKVAQPAAEQPANEPAPEEMFADESKGEPVTEPVAAGDQSGEVVVAENVATPVKARPVAVKRA